MANEVPCPFHPKSSCPDSCVLHKKNEFKLDQMARDLSLNTSRPVTAQDVAHLISDLRTTPDQARLVAQLREIYRGPISIRQSQCSNSPVTP
jgi:hypothetical protein